jgi:hypothetical protein
MDKERIKKAKDRIPELPIWAQNYIMWIEESLSLAKELLGIEPEGEKLEMPEDPSKAAGLDYVDEDPKACDLCGKDKQCTSITALCGDVVVVCEDCLQNIMNMFKE